MLRLKVITEKVVMLNISRQLASHHQLKVIAKQMFHTTHGNRDVDAAIKAVGAGVAATGTTGAGIGLGLIFSSLLAGTARNPSLKNQLFPMAIMGAALAESMGLFSLLIAFLCLFS